MDHSMSVKEFDLRKLDTSMKSDKLVNYMMRNISLPNKGVQFSISTGDLTISKPAVKTTGGLIDLKDVTFIIPVKIDSDDRMSNFLTTYQYLTKTLDTNIIIYESDKQSVLVDKIGDNVKYFFEQCNDGVLHRTRYLNFMLNTVTTPVTVNYDIDVTLLPNTYVEARNAVLNGFDLIYPYEYGNFQQQVNQTGRDKVLQGSSLDTLTNSDFLCRNYSSQFGHCSFFNTNSYKKFGYENENFVSYGPEDFERYNRFVKLKTTVGHLKSHYVYHFEHKRGNNSNSNNPFFKHNVALSESLNKMTENELLNYYNTVDYLNKYK